MGRTTEAGILRVVRLSTWLLAGVVFGVVVGFAFGLTKPRIPSPGTRE
jgi:hypothetical protein